MLDLLRQHLAAGLMRKSSTSCSRWAQNYVILGKPIPGPLRFPRFPWTREMHDCDGDWVGMKSAQMAYTATALDRALFTIDIKRVDVLYILPKRSPDASDFSKAKFDILLELSPHLRELFSNVRNIGHKQAGNTNLFIRGARSRSGLKSISVGLRVYDEYDEMPMKNISLADERSSGYDREDKQNIKLSTPTVPDFGIDAEYKLTTQEHFFFTCPHCGRITELVYPECLVITADDINDPKLRESYLQCRECKKALAHSEKPIWLASGKWESTTNSKALVRGFHINQLYSTTVEPWEIAKSVLKAQSDPAEEQELQNSKLGIAHVVEGARVTDQMIDQLLAGHKCGSPAPANQLITMGVDVGKWLHFQISQWLLPAVGPDLNMTAVERVIHVGKVKDFSELNRLMEDFQVIHAVIDANPEHRKAYEFAQTFFGHVHLCYFARGIRGKHMLVNDAAMTVSVDRTSWLDLSQSRFRKGKKALILPYDISQEYRDQVKALVRIEKRDPDGNPVARYISVGKNQGADHSAFAHVYAEIALPLAVSLTEGKDVNAFL